MNKNLQRWTTAAILFLAAAAQAGMNPGPAKAGSSGLEKMKQLVGVWEGPDAMDPKGPPMKLVYELTAGGNAVMERIKAGTPGEMVTLYYDQDGKTTLTHYCSVGNRPVMALKSTDKDTLVFDLVEGSVPAGEAHMHNLALTFTDADHLKAVWTMRDPAQKGDMSHPMEFTRKR